MQFRLVKCLWNSRTMEVDDLIEGVWGAESKTSESALKSAIYRTNQAFMEKNIPVDLNQKSGHVTLTITAK